MDRTVQQDIFSSNSFETGTVMDENILERVNQTLKLSNQKFPTSTTPVKL